MAGESPEVKSANQKLGKLFESARKSKDFREARRKGQDMVQLGLLGESPDENEKITAIFHDTYDPADYHTDKNRPTIEEGKTHMLLGNVDGAKFNPEKVRDPDFYQDLVRNANLFLKIEEYVEIDFVKGAKRTRMLKIIEAVKSLGNGMNEKSFQQHMKKNNVRMGEVYGRHGLLQVLVGFARAIEPVPYEKRDAMLTKGNFEITQKNLNPLFYKISIGIGKRGLNEADRNSTVLKIGAAVVPSPTAGDPDAKVKHNPADADDLQPPDDDDDDPAAAAQPPAAPPAQPTVVAAPPAAPPVTTTAAPAAPPATVVAAPPAAPPVTTTAAPAAPPAAPPVTTTQPPAAPPATVVAAPPAAPPVTTTAAPAAPPAQPAVVVAPPAAPPVTTTQPPAAAATPAAAAPPAAPPVTTTQPPAATTQPAGAPPAGSPSPQPPEKLQCLETEIDGKAYSLEYTVPERVEIEYDYTLKAYIVTKGPDQGIFTVTKTATGYNYEFKSREGAKSINDIWKFYKFEGSSYEKDGEKQPKVIITRLVELKDRTFPNVNLIESPDSITIVNLFGPNISSESAKYKVTNKSKGVFTYKYENLNGRQRIMITEKEGKFAYVSFREGKKEPVFESGDDDYDKDLLQHLKLSSKDGEILIEEIDKTKTKTSNEIITVKNALGSGMDEDYELVITRPEHQKISPTMNISDNEFQIEFGGKRGRIIFGENGAIKIGSSGEKTSDQDLWLDYELVLDDTKTPKIISISKRTARMDQKTEFDGTTLTTTIITGTGTPDIKTIEKLDLTGAPGLTAEYIGEYIGAVNNGYYYGTIVIRKGNQSMRIESNGAAYEHFFDESSSSENDLWKDYSITRGNGEIKVVERNGVSNPDSPIIYLAENSVKDGIGSFEALLPDGDAVKYKLNIDPELQLTYKREHNTAILYLKNDSKEYANIIFNKDGTPIVYNASEATHYTYYDKATNNIIFKKRTLNITTASGKNTIESKNSMTPKKYTTSSETKEHNTIEGQKIEYEIDRDHRGIISFNNQDDPVFEKVIDTAGAEVPKRGFTMHVNSGGIEVKAAQVKAVSVTGKATRYKITATFDNGETQEQKVILQAGTPKSLEADGEKAKITVDSVIGHLEFNEIDKPPVLGGAITSKIATKETKEGLLIRAKVTANQLNAKTGNQPGLVVDFLGVQEGEIVNEDAIIFLNNFKEAFDSLTATQKTALKHCTFKLSRKTERFTHQSNALSATINYENYTVDSIKTELEKAFSLYFVDLEGSGHEALAQKFKDDRDMKTPVDANSADHMVLWYSCNDIDNPVEGDIKYYTNPKTIGEVKSRYVFEDKVWKEVLNFK